MTQREAPAPRPGLEYAFSVRLKLSPPKIIGACASGANLAAVQVREGEVFGPALRGKVTPMSGVDWAQMRPDGVLDVDVRYMIETEDGVPIILHNRGYRWGPPDVMRALAEGQSVDPSAYYMRVTPRFEAPPGDYEWLTKHAFIGAGGRVADGNEIHYYKVT